MIATSTTTTTTDMIPSKEEYFFPGDTSQATTAATSVTMMDSWVDDGETASPGETVSPGETASPPSVVVSTTVLPSSSNSLRPQQVRFEKVSVQSFCEDDAVNSLHTACPRRDLSMDDFELQGGCRNVFKRQFIYKTKKQPNTIGRAARKLRKALFGSKKVYNQRIMLDKDLTCTTKPLWQAPCRSSSSLHDTDSLAQPTLRRCQSMGALELMDATTTQELLHAQPGRFGANHKRERTLSTGSKEDSLAALLSAHC